MSFEVSMEENGKSLFWLNSIEHYILEFQHYKNEFCSMALLEIVHKRFCPEASEFMNS